VAVYFASDMHLRLDRPERSGRLARWVDGLDPVDELYLVGDVCDFWFATRQRRGDPLACPGLRALAGFRARGGMLTILPGNHDHWLGRFYETVLGARFVSEPLLVEAHNLRIQLNHGHRTGGRAPWKFVMESLSFFQAFERLPAAVANRLDRMLETSNDLHRERDERRVMPRFRRHAEEVGQDADIVVFGHIHTPLDDARTSPRLVILGGWHTRTSYLKIDDQGARLIVAHDSIPVAI
jgi:UDP-2,3-diacylglucosamine hydrolase